MVLSKKPVILMFIFFAFINGLSAQVSFPVGDFWSLDAGLGMSDVVVHGASFQFIIEPKLWLSDPLMVGAKFGVNYSSEEDSRNILAFETQAFIRWNFLHLGKQDNPIHIFAQVGIGLISAYRGNAEEPSKLFSDVTMTRGSLLGDVAAGVTIPLTKKWHIEPSVRGGYPHVWGVSVTAGYKFPLPEKGKISTNYIMKDLPPKEIVKRIMISSVEYILFSGDIGRYNVGIDRDAQGLNELVLDSIAQFLKDNPDCVVRIEGHANPITVDPTEAEELLMLSRQRSIAVADQLRQRGVPNDQMALIYYGGTRTVTSDHEIWNRNRRVELIIIQIDNDMDTN